MGLTGLKAFSYALEGSQDFINWMPLHTNTADANGVLNFQDNSAPATHRFYRAVEK